MKEQTLKLENPEGLHARPAAILAKLAGGFHSKVEINAKGQQKNAKSIMALMSLGLEQGDEIKIIIDGADEDSAMDQILALIQGGFKD